jgi:hypothetical protein
MGLNEIWLTFRVEMGFASDVVDEVQDLDDDFLRTEVENCEHRELGLITKSARMD